MQDVYLEKITEFTRLLRQQGLSVGHEEQLAAVAALEAVGFTDKSVTRDALQAVLAKSQKEQQTFQAVFDSWFVNFDRKLEQAKAQREEQRKLEQRREQLEQELEFNGKQVPLREDMKELYLRLPEEERDKLLKRVDRYRDSAERHPGLYDNFIQSIFLRTILEQQIMSEDVGLGNTDDPDADLLYRDISSFGETDLQRAVALIQRIARQLSGELTSRRKKGGHSGALDFRATLRKGLETGGALTRLRFRKKRQHRRRLVLLCDVSGSMMQFSEFVLRFMKSLTEATDRSAIYLFSEELRRVDPFALQNMDGFRNYVRNSGCFGMGTNLGSALASLLAVRPSEFNGSTVFLVLTDCKTVEVDRAAAELERISRLAGKVVLLCPIPREKWQYLNGCRTLSQAADMLPCSTIEELASACRRLFGG